MGRKGEKEASKGFAVAVTGYGKAGLRYDYCRVHQTLRVTPAMEAVHADHVWSPEEIIALLPIPTVSKSTIDRGLFRRVLG